MVRCYGWRPDTGVFPFIDGFMYQCPGSQGCCATGDTCHEDAICQSNHSQPAGYYSGYYINSCADPTFTSPDCSKLCTTLTAPDVTYNYTSSEWACCGRNVDGNVSCNTPSDVTFSAPAPEKLAVLVSTTSSSQLPTSTTTISPAASQTAQPSSTSQSLNPHSQTSLSVGAIAGIVIGSVLCLLLVLGFVGLWSYQRKRVRSQPRTMPPIIPDPQEKDASASYRYEINGSSKVFPQELDGRNTSSWTTDYSYRSVPQHSAT